MVGVWSQESCSSNYVNHSLNSLKGGLISGRTIGLVKGDTRSLDFTIAHVATALLFDAACLVDSSSLVSQPALNKQAHNMPERGHPKPESLTHMKCTCVLKRGNVALVRLDSMPRNLL